MPMSTSDARKRRVERALWAEFLDLPNTTVMYLAGALVQRLYDEDPAALARMIDEAKANAS